MKKKLEDAKGLWVDDLPEILWTLQTTSNTTTQQTPFTLAFGQDIIVPVKIGNNALRISKYNEESNGERLLMNLDLLEEEREEACINAIIRKKQIS